MVTVLTLRGWEQLELFWKAISLKYLEGVGAGLWATFKKDFNLLFRTVVISSNTEPC